MELFKDLVDLSSQMQNPQKPTAEWEILTVERLELTTLEHYTLVNIVSVTTVMFNAAILPNHYFSVLRLTTICMSLHKLSAMANLYFTVHLNFYRLGLSEAPHPITYQLPLK